MKDKNNTTIETQLINVINDFVKWDTNKENRDKAQKYIDYVKKNKHYNYNKWFRVTKDDVIKFIVNNSNKKD
tara:strand:- start:270 stop:485 length:216 start_codon:yes stop_codon:yes gene_type:complete